MLLHLITQTLAMTVERHLRPEATQNHRPCLIEVIRKWKLRLTMDGDWINLEIKKHSTENGASAF
jgi:hypothetical protein